MQEKLIDILSRATAWMTAGEIAEAGNWRSHANVGIALQQIERSTGNVERRKSPTKKMRNGMPETEWKLTEKTIAESTETKMGRKPKHPPLEPASSEADALRKQIADMHAESAGLCSLIEEQRNQIAKLNEQLMHGEEAVDVKDAARGYLVCAPKRKPAKLMKAESAVARAKSAAKATGRCWVFALVPVGVATRKQIKAVEFKERAA